MYNMYVGNHVFTDKTKEDVILYVRKYSGLKLRRSEIDTILNGIYKSNTLIIVVNNHTIRIDYVETL